MVVFVVSLEYRGPESQLAEIGYEIARRRIEHRVKMEQVESEARRLLLPPHAEPMEEQAETGAEFFPDVTGEDVPAVVEGQIINPAPIVAEAPKEHEASLEPNDEDQAIQSPKGIKEQKLVPPEDLMASPNGPRASQDPKKMKTTREDRPTLF
jgi:hypothetical protein